MKMRIGEYGDFVQSVTQIMNSYPISSRSSDKKQLMEVQDDLLSTLAIM